MYNTLPAIPVSGTSSSWVESDFRYNSETAANTDGIPIHTGGAFTERAPLLPPPRHGSTLSPIGAITNPAF